ncbi:MAG: hypothetical protein ABII00_06765 [Elusimicrobiota bacterium]
MMMGFAYSALGVTAAAVTKPSDWPEGWPWPPYDYPDDPWAPGWEPWTDGEVKEAELFVVGTDGRVFVVFHDGTWGELAQPSIVDLGFHKATISGSPYYALPGLDGNPVQYSVDKCGSFDSGAAVGARAGAAETDNVYSSLVTGDVLYWVRAEGGNVYRFYKSTTGGVTGAELAALTLNLGTGISVFRVTASGRLWIVGKNAVAVSRYSDDEATSWTSPGMTILDVRLSETTVYACGDPSGWGGDGLRKSASNGDALSWVPVSPSTKFMDRFLWASGEELLGNGKQGTDPGIWYRADEATEWVRVIDTVYAVGDAVERDGYVYLVTSDAKVQRAAVTDLTAWTTLATLPIAGNPVGV